MSPSKQKSQEQQWSQWAAEAQAGDQKAYHQLLKSITPYIQGSMNRSLANPDWVDDLTQNVLISIHKSLGTYSPDRPFKPWLGAIMNFRQKDFLRAYYSRRGDKSMPYEEEFLQSQHVTNPTHAGEYKDVEAALAELPDKQRKVFQLIKIEGYTAKEVAKRLNMTVSAVKVSAHRTTKKLKAKLG